MEIKSSTFQMLTGVFSSTQVKIKPSIFQMLIDTY